MKLFFSETSSLSSFNKVAIIDTNKKLFILLAQIRAAVVFFRQPYSTNLQQMLRKELL